MTYLASLSRAGLLCALLLLVAAPARADSWAMPEVATYVSANGAYRLTVVPRDIGSQLAYFEAKAGGETLPEPEGPLGRFERLEGGAWVSVWSRGLVNEVAPVRVLVSDDGRHVATFDNWHSTGYGDNVVVIYGDGGALVRSLSLDEIVPAYFIDGLPTSVSSIRWQSEEPRLIAGDMIALTISQPDDILNKAAGFSVHVALADGRVEPVSAEAMARLRPAFCAAHVARVGAANAYLDKQRAALVYPGGADSDAWLYYIHQAIMRLRVPASAGEVGRDDWEDELPIQLLNAGEFMEADYRKDFREALLLRAPELPRRWFAARDQDKMVREIERQARKIKPGQLAGVQMLFVTDQPLWARIAAALSVSGATLTLVDPAVPIAPRPDDVAALSPARVVDAACQAPA